MKALYIIILAFALASCAGEQSKDSKTETTKTEMHTRALDTRDTVLKTSTFSKKKAPVKVLNEKPQLKPQKFNKRPQK